MKPVYEYFEPSWYRDNREYYIVVREGSKSHGYCKRRGKRLVRHDNPNPGGMKFKGYMTKERFEDKLFIDAL